MIMAALSQFLAAQHLHRVNNNPGFSVTYTTLQAAVDAASNGDTIYMEGSTTGYDGAIITKKVTIIGPGFFLNENPKTQANRLGAEFISSITFDNGSEGSCMMGITFDFNVYLFINTSDITVIRNYLYRVDFQGTSNNIMLSQNYIENIIYGYFGTISNTIISNNIIMGDITTTDGSGPLVISNNVMGYIYGNDIKSYNASIQNNIFCSENAEALNNPGNNISNNIFAGDGTDANGNLYNVNMTMVFADFNNTMGMSTDGKWKLRDASPAAGAGVGGTDCGAFGGLAPYILSGIPNLPHIYEASIQAAATSESGLQVSLKIKSGDE